MMRWQAQVPKALVGVVMATVAGFGCSEDEGSAETKAAPPIPWLFEDTVPIDVMNTVSTLQQYGPYLGFHHGLDFHAPAATRVYAPTSGIVGTRYYYRIEHDYTYEISIESDDGLRWELHHVDKPTIPPAIEELADRGGRLEAGTYVGNVYDGALVEVESHVHINVLDQDGRFLNPLRFLPALSDDMAPTVNQVFFLQRGRSALQIVDDCTIERGKKRCIVVLDAHDDINGSSWEHSLYQLDFYVRVGADWQHVHGFEFDQLPDPDFLVGWTEVYWYEVFQDASGATVQNEIETIGDRRFLYRLPLEPVDLGEEASASEARLVLRDFAGNETEETFSLASDP